MSFCEKISFTPVFAAGCQASFVAVFVLISDGSLLIRKGPLE
jgi:hypothetical protein